MCFITQWDPATNRQNELAITQVIGKLAHLGWIRLRPHARNLHCRILCSRAFRQRRGVAKGAVLLYLHDQLVLSQVPRSSHSFARWEGSAERNQATDLVG